MCAVFRFWDVNLSDIMFLQKPMEVYWSGQLPTNTGQIQAQCVSCDINYMFHSSKINAKSSPHYFATILPKEWKTASHAATHKLYLHAAIRWPQPCTSLLLSHATFRLTPEGPKPRLTSSRATHPSSWQQPHLGDEEQSRQRNLDPLKNNVCQYAEWTGRPRFTREIAV